MPHLDALRAIAIGAVLLEHWGGPLVRATFPVGAGNLGVDLFFTLSGFLITSILLESFDKTVSPRWIVWRNFYIRRILRLVPFLYLTILLLVIIDVGNMRTAWPWHASYLSNVYMIAGGEMTVFWSLAVEEHFYLIWPFVIAFTPRDRLFQVVAAIVVLGIGWKVVALALGLQNMTANLLLMGNLETLGAGCALAIFSYRAGRTACFEWYQGAVAVKFDVIAWSCVALALASWFMFGKKGVIRQLTNDVLLATFFVWLVLHGARGFSGLLRHIFDFAPLQYVGRISYGIYIFHNYPPDILEKYFGLLPKAMAAPIVVVLTFGICSLSWHFIEQPIMRLKRFFREAPTTAKPALAMAQLRTIE